MESFRQETLGDIDRNTIAFVLDEALKQNYTKASVQSITSDRDLSKPPFNLAAEGICGNTALLDFGDDSYFRKPFTEMNVYNFKHFLRLIGRDNSNSFIFGHGIFRHITNCSLSEIVLNASFPPATNKERERNSSGLTIIDSTIKKCKKDIISLSKLECVIQGTYFLSEGLKAASKEPVLRVYAKGPYFDKTPFCGSKRFINSMQVALQNRFGSEHFVALGVYEVTNVTFRHKLIRNCWETPLNLANRYCSTDPKKPEIMITTFNSGTGPRPIIPVSPLIKLNSSQSIHPLSHHSALENHLKIYDRNKEEEYLGYFCPAKTLYRIDEPPQRNEFNL